MLKKIIFLLTLFCFSFSLAVLPVAAERSSTTASWLNASTTPANLPVKPKVDFDAACILAALDKRDTAIIAAHNAFSAAIAKVLETRKNDLKTAWGNADRKARIKAIRAAWKNYQKERLKIKNKLHADTKAAWKEFNTEKKKCKISTFDDLTGQGADLD
jgi:hypothetical protein